MFKINYMYTIILFIVILGSIGCDEIKNKNSKKYEFDVKLHNLSGHDLDWCAIYANPPKYNILFDSSGVMPNGVYATKSFLWGIIPNKARLSYLFEREVDKVAEMRKAGLDESEKFAESKMKYIKFDIDTNKIKEILQKKKRPYLVISIIGLDKIETKIIPAD